MDIDPNEVGWIELMGPDVALKRIHKGAGVTSAEVGTTVICSLKLYKQGCNNPIEVCDRESYVIGEGDGVPGLELGLRHSIVGDKLLIKCAAKFCYGGTGRPPFGSFPAIDPDTNLIFEAEIFEHNAKEASSDSIKDILGYISLRKEAGNRWFKYSDFLRAGRCYSKGAQEAEKVYNFSNEDSLQIQIKSIYLTCLNNLAACHLTMGEYYKAKEACLQLLHIDPNNIKGLSRGGKASLAMHDFEECEACLQRLLRLEPDNETGKKEFVKLMKAKKSYKDKTKAISKNMAKHLFGNNSDTSNDTLHSHSGFVDSTSSSKDSEDIRKNSSSNSTQAIERHIVGVESSSNSRQWIGLLITSLLTLLVSIIIGYYIYVTERRSD